ncbi:MAG: TIGR00730 family Rossman fold protein [Chloroflexi bacterium]|nr:TIGR00730 family Rossman fold protein [Chloroflexota bacterium]MDA1146290.1 TIGR00730 family Rossman fold protein [Chloroflexota bacterium]
MAPLRRICVFTGSSPGRRDDYRIAAQSLGVALAGRGTGLVYGGANVGLMGILANAALEAGGEVIGVLPESLVSHEVAHPGLTELHTVDCMHARKAMMVELSDAFVAMPGGFGTIDEFFEVLTWSQLGLHQKPCALFNIAGYFDPLLEFIDGAVRERFLAESQRDALIVEGDVPALLAAIEAFQPVYVEKWLDRE